jgi:hypothetical protein
MKRPEDYLFHEFVAFLDGRVAAECVRYLNDGEFCSLMDRIIEEAQSRIVDCEAANGKLSA